MVWIQVLWTCFFFKNFPQKFKYNEPETDFLKYKLHVSFLEIRKDTDACYS